MSIKDQLIKQINAGKISFDNNSVELRQQLLQENAGQLISEKLQKLILFMSTAIESSIRISSIVRNPDVPSDHGKRRAVDIGNEEIAAKLLPIIGAAPNVSLYDIDEIIFNAGGQLPSGPNRWNFKNGKPHHYDNATLNAHKDHIHVSIKL
jgi:hypothetical protein